MVVSYFGTCNYKYNSARRDVKFNFVASMFDADKRLKRTSLEKKIRTTTYN